MFNPEMCCCFFVASLKNATGVVVKTFENSFIPHLVLCQKTKNEFVKKVNTIEDNKNGEIIEGQLSQDAGRLVTVTLKIEEIVACACIKLVLTLFL